jgi:predicted DNA-binding protein (MmcQ/YjbR family)
MTYDELRAHLLSFPDAVEETPFGPEALVFKVCGKMFALLMVGSDPPRMNLKCVPETALRLRADYASIQPGYHMNKKHWNTVIADGTVPRELLEDLMEASWTLVVSGLRRRDRVRLLGE